MDNHLQRAAHSARVWSLGWGLSIGAGGAASLAMLPFVAPSDRIDWYTGAVTAAIGVVPFVVSPLSVTRDAPGLHAALAAPPPPPDADVCPLLLDAERALVQGARDERLQRAWWVHAGNVAFNAGVLLFLGLGFQHWLSGILNGSAGLVVGEAIILTSPEQTNDALAQYRRAALDDPTPR